jgi:hypothetical protein
MLVKRAKKTGSPDEALRTIHTVHTHTINTVHTPSGVAIDTPSKLASISVNAVQRPSVTASPVHADNSTLDDDAENTQLLRNNAPESSVDQGASQEDNSSIVAEELAKEEVLAQADATAKRKMQFPTWKPRKWSRVATPIGTVAGKFMANIWAAGT